MTTALHLIIHENGYIWRLAASTVAANRACYYAENDESTDVLTEYAFGMDNPDELLDWFQNNMDWADVETDARLVHIPSGVPTPSVNADMVIVTPEIVAATVAKMAEAAES